MKRALAALLLLAGLAYPFALYALLGKVGMLWIILPMALLWLLRACFDNQQTRLSRGLALGMAAFLLALGALSGQQAEMGLRLYPVLVNAMLLAVFALSLSSGMPLIERLARLRHGDLPKEGVRYTRKVTQVWCVFFAANGLVALWLALFGSLASWTLYNGLISYLLIGALLLGEWCVRPAQGKRA